MTTIHEIIAKFKSFPFREDEGLLILVVDEKATSSYVHFHDKTILRDALVRIFKKNPDLLAVCSNAVDVASISCPIKDKKKLEPRLQKFLDKILKDFENLDENNN